MSAQNKKIDPIETEIKAEIEAEIAEYQAEIAEINAEIDELGTLRVNYRMITENLRELSHRRSWYQKKLEEASCRLSSLKGQNT